MQSTSEVEPDVRAFLASTLFGQAGAQALDELVAQARVERFEVSTLLNAAGEPLRWLRYVVEGHLEIVSRRANGKEVAVSDVQRGGWAVWLPCFVPVPPEHDFYSGPASCYIALPVRAVRQFCEQNPHIYPLIIAEIGQRLRLLMEWVGQSVLLNPEQRMAKLIHIVARDQKMTGQSGTVVVSQARLASLGRCSRQTANALLQQLEKRGLISLAYGRFRISNLAQLIAFAENEQD